MLARNGFGIGDARFVVATDKTEQMRAQRPPWLIVTERLGECVARVQRRFRFARFRQRRAEAVRDYLIRQGVAAERLTAQGYGETNPVADNKTREGRAKNRRVELIPQQ